MSLATVRANAEKRGTKKAWDKRLEDTARAGYRKMVNGKGTSVDSGNDDSEVRHDAQIKGSSTAGKGHDEKSRTVQHPKATVGSSTY